MPAPSPAQTVERRAWVRYICDIPSVLTSEKSPAPVKSLAIIQDISRGGVKLVLTAPIQPGTLVELDVATRVAHHSLQILASILRLEQQSEDRWVAACAFACEIEEDELEQIGIENTWAFKEQRAQPRLSCGSEVRFQFASGQNRAWQSGRLVDMSPIGLGMLVESDVELGDLFSIQFDRSDSDEPLTMLSSVVRRETQPAFGQFVGCNFIRELTDAEFSAIVAGQTLQAA